MTMLTDAAALLAVLIAGVVVARAVRGWWRGLVATGRDGGGCSACGSQGCGARKSAAGSAAGTKLPD